jgi:dihydrofolate reductase
MTAALLVAAAENEVIGRDGDLPWHLPGDLRRFARLTRGHPVVMGRLTHESIWRRLGGPLPGRQSIVISRDPPAGAEGVTWAASPAEAADVAGSMGQDESEKDWFVIGGASVYQHLLDRVSRIHLTRVHAIVEGDTRMPPGWLDGFTVTTAQSVPDDAADFAYSFIQLDRTRTR